MNLNAAKAFVKQMPDELFLLSGTLYYECCCDFFEVYPARDNDGEPYLFQRLANLQSRPKVTLVAGRELTQAEYQQLDRHNNEGMTQALESLFLRQLTEEGASAQDYAAFDLALVKLFGGSLQPAEHYGRRQESPMFGQKWYKAIIRYEGTKIGGISETLIDWVRIWTAFRDPVLRARGGSWHDVFTPQMMSILFSGKAVSYLGKDSPPVFFKSQEEAIEMLSTAPNVPVPEVLKEPEPVPEPAPAPEPASAPEPQKSQPEKTSVALEQTNYYHLQSLLGKTKMTEKLAWDIINQSVPTQKVRTAVKIDDFAS
ncbi:MAG: hypothetical protein IK089_06135, partial [Oxalobacter sp.]|nr:hypothetical protein [Oxalobacter sp.]